MRELINFDKYIFEKKKKKKVDTGFLPDKSRMLLVAPSGMGKTTLLGNYLINDDFMDKRKNQKVFILTAMPNEELYDFIYEALTKMYGIPEENILMTDVVSEFPSVDQLIKEGDKTTPKKIIFDDFIAREGKELKEIQRMMDGYFTRGRHINCSTFVLSQNYYSIPKKTRNNCTGVHLWRFNNKKDKQLFCSELASGLETDEVMEMYDRAVKKDHDFLTYFPGNKEGEWRQGLEHILRE